MDQNISSKIKDILIYIIIAAVAFVGGYYFGAAVAEDRAAELRRIAVKEIFGSVPFTRAISGKILEISSDKKSLVIEAFSVFGVNFPSEYRRKNVLITPETKFTRREPKDPSVFIKEVEEFAKKQKITKDVLSLSRPLPFIEKEIKIDDLRIGDNVDLIFASEEGKSFLDNELTAVQIDVER